MTSAFMVTSAMIRLSAGEFRKTILENRTSRPNLPALERLHSLANELSLYDMSAAEKADRAVDLAGMLYKSGEGSIEYFASDKVFHKILSLTDDIADIANEYEERGY